MKINYNIFKNSVSLKNITCLILLLVTTFSVVAQQVDKEKQKALKESRESLSDASYEMAKDNFTIAEAEYREAIALNPKYLFFDEPNSGLDPKTAIVIDNLIKELTIDFNTVTVINTHDMNSVVEIGDNVAFIYKGEKWWEGSNEDILKSDNKELNDFVFATKLMRSIKK